LNQSTQRPTSEFRGLNDGSINKDIIQ